MTVLPVTTEDAARKEGTPMPGPHQNEIQEVPKTALQKISLLLNSDKGLNGTFGALDPNESNVEVYGQDDGEEFEFQRQQLVQYESNDDPDKSRDLALRDLMPRQYRTEVGASKLVRAKTIVQFVVVRRDKGSSEEWEFLEKPEFMSLLNDIEHNNCVQKNGLSAALEYNNMWGLVPILGLRIRNLSLLDRFRDQIDQFQSNHSEYTTFPKLGLDRKFAITIMLWQDLSNFKLDILPRNLLDRNPDLAGGVRISKVKTFKESDSDTRAVSYTHLTLPTTPYV